MPTKQIEEFAKVLVGQVRDAAIRDCDMNLRPDAQSTTGKRWRLLRVGDSGAAAEAIIPDCVDEALFFLLSAVDQGLLRLQFVTENGDVVDLAAQGHGELAGWYIGPDGWRSAYSEERFSEFVETADVGKPSAGT